MAEEISKCYMKKIIYVNNPRRAHKILPLLVGMDVLVIKDWAGFLHVRKFKDGDCAVLIDSFGSFGVKGMMLALVFGLPLVVRLRGDFFRERREVYEIAPSLFARIKYFGQYWVAVVCLKIAKLVIVNSQYLKRRMLQIYPQKNLAVVYNPYTECKSLAGAVCVNLPSRGKHVLSITNFNLSSKVEPLLAAMRDWVSEELWELLDIYWIVCGAGPLLDSFQKKIEELPYSNRIFCLGHVEDVTSLYRWANVFVHLTELDAFPNVTLEAMMHKVPVVTNDSSCGTLEQIKHGVNGMVVGNDVEFQSAIRFYFEDEQNQLAHGEKGRKVVRRFFLVERQAEEMKRAMELI